MEVHGPHLPVGADLYEADGLLLRAAEKVAERHPDLTFLHLPGVFAAADVLPHKGSLRFRPGTVVRVLEDLGASLAAQGIHDIWVSNFHGGPRHFVAIEAACARVQKRHGARMVPLFSLLIGRLTGGTSDVSGLMAEALGVPAADLQGDVHGGALETSILLHLVGALIDPMYRDLPPRTLNRELREAGRRPVHKGERPTLLELLRSFPLSYRYFERTTYAGAPARATPEGGRRALETFTDHAATALDEVLDGSLPPARWHSPLWPLRSLLLNETFGALVDRVLATRPPGV